MRDEPSPEDKLRLARGESLEAWDYRFRAPPVCTARWNAHDWVRYIDACRGWFPKVTRP